MFDKQEIMAAMDEELRQELVDMTVDLVNIPSPTGEEKEIGNYVAKRFSELGLDVSLQEVEKDRNNVIAVAKGSGGGKSLLFNAHFDTSTTGKETEKGLGAAHKSNAQVIDGWIYGLGVSNMKSAFAGYYGAIRLLQKTGLQPKGDVIITGVVGEIEKAPIDQYQGVEFRGGGTGSMYLAHHGVTADMCIIGEPTGLRLQIGNSGYAFVKISTSGVAQHTWSKEFGIDAIEKMEKVMAALRKWEPEFEAKHPHPFMKNRVGIGAIQGGYPFKPAICPAPFCNLYVDLRFLPQQSIVSVKNELEDVLNKVREENPGLDTEIEIYLARRGFEISEDEYVVQALKRSHKAVFGKEVTYPYGYRFAVSADASIFHEYGIPSLTYGPGGITRTGQYSMYDGALGECVGIDNLVNISKSYALAIMDICSQPK